MMASNLYTGRFMPAFLGTRPRSNLSEPQRKRALVIGIPFVRAFYMRATLFDLAFTALVVDVATALPQWSGHTPPQAPTPGAGYYVSLGPRPYYIIDNMTK